MDYSEVAIPEYEETDEEFNGPLGLTDFFNEDEPDGYSEPDAATAALELSGVQSADPYEVAHPEGGSAHTQTLLHRS